MKQNRPKRVRYAVVGLGYISQAAMMPAFAHARSNSELTALVSGDAVKLKRLAKRYGVKHTATYEGYDALLASGTVDAVYIGLPNTLHRDFTERAARANVHVLCEKPMAMTSADCQAMAQAAEAANVRLMIGYRLHFDPANLAAVAAAVRRKIGEPLLFDSCFTMQVKPGNIRLKRALGGGTLWDIGIYCINAARYLFRSEPTQVQGMVARSSDPRFREVEASASALLRFPDERLATFTASFGAADVSAYRLVGTKGSLRLDPAYEHASALVQETKLGERVQRRTFPHGDQFAPELLHFSDCVLKGREPAPSAREGLADVRIIEALYASSVAGRPVDLPPFPEPARPLPKHALHRPPLKKVPLVHAEPPTT